VNRSNTRGSISGAMPLPVFFDVEVRQRIDRRGNFRHRRALL
jgi:hypothetical protein